MNFFKYIPKNVKKYLKKIRKNFIHIIFYKGDIVTKFNLCVYGSEDRHSFFGYYDISPFNFETDEILYLELSEDEKSADVILEDIANETKQKFTTTYAWNWQQGSRLRWFPNSIDEIMFNDYRDGKYITRIVNVRNKQERKIDFPLYDVDKSGCYGLSLDFERLGALRPGYGYNVEGYNAPDNLDELGVDLIDIKKNTSVRIIRYKELAELLNNNKKVSPGNYINHISFSPSGGKFMFFWLTIVDNFHKAYLIVYDFKKKKIVPIETKKKVSHYRWRDDENILATSYDEKKLSCRYYLYSIDGVVKVVCPNSLKCDGHPSILSTRLFLTDTYPDLVGYQKLLVCDTESDLVETVLKIKSFNAGKMERRTDLHPRIHKDMICFDANISGRRKLYILKNFNKI